MVRVPDTTRGYTIGQVPLRHPCCVCRLLGVPLANSRAGQTAGEAFWPTPYERPFSLPEEEQTPEAKRVSTGVKRGVRPPRQYLLPNGTK